MTSKIDPSVPVYGNPTTDSVRQNFQIAADEISALQAIQQAPPLEVYASGPIAAVGNQSVNVHSDAGPLDLLLDVGLYLDHVLKIKDVTGSAGTSNVTIHAPAGATIDGQDTYVLAGNYASVELYWTGAMWGTR